MALSQNTCWQRRRSPLQKSCIAVLAMILRDEVQSLLFLQEEAAALEKLPRFL